MDMFLQIFCIRTANKEYVGEILISSSTEATRVPHRQWRRRLHRYKLPRFCFGQTSGIRTHGDKFRRTHKELCLFKVYFYLVCEVIGTAATPDLLCLPECRLARETEVLGENLPQRHFCPSQNTTWRDPGLNAGRRGGKPATNRLSYDATPFLRLPRKVWCT
jgi:hypothetical protein